jgi:streptogramin lyase
MYAVLIKEFFVAHRVQKKHALAAACFLLLIAVSASAQSASESLPNPYGPAIEKWGQLPEGRTWGAIGGGSLDSKGNLWVFERCGANSCAGSTVAPIVELDPSGKTIKSFGAGMFVLPHAIFVDKQDNVWVVDADAKDGKGDQITKFTPGGKVLMTLGKAGVSDDGQDTFNSPTGVVVGPNGDIFVADGHGAKTNARVVKFSKDGKFLQIWGKKGSAPGEFDEPHSIAMDSKGRVFVVDRGNSRIQIFDQNGEFLAQWKQFGVPSGIFIDKNDVMYVAENRLSPEWKRGIRIGSAKDGKVTGFIPDPDQTPEGRGIGPENVVADLTGTLYAGEVDRKMIKKYVKQ